MPSDHKKAAEGEQSLAIGLGRIGRRHALGEGFNEATAFGGRKGGQKRPQRGATHKIHHGVRAIENLQIDGLPDIEIAGVGLEPAPIGFGGGNGGE